MAGFLHPDGMPPSRPIQSDSVTQSQGSIASMKLHWIMHLHKNPTPRPQFGHRFVNVIQNCIAFFGRRPQVVVQVRCRSFGSSTNIAVVVMIIWREVKQSQGPTPSIRNGRRITSNAKILRRTTRMISRRGITRSCKGVIASQSCWKSYPLWRQQQTQNLLYRYQEEDSVVGDSNRHFD